LGTKNVQQQNDNECVHGRCTLRDSVTHTKRDVTPFRA